MGRGGAVLRPAAEAVGQLARAWAWAWQGGAFLVARSDDGVPLLFMDMEYGYCASEGRVGVAGGAWGNLARARLPSPDC